MNKEYLMHMVMHEETLNIMYLTSIIVTPINILVMIPLLISASLFMCIELKRTLDINPTALIISIGSCKDTILKGADPGL